MAFDSQRLDFLKQAVDMARENVRAGRGGPFAALVVREGRIVASATNQVTSTNDPTAHAEVMAIRAAARQLASHELTRCEVFASCEPCPMCLGAIYWARCQAVYFAATSADAAKAGFDDSFIYRQIELPPGQRLIPALHLPVENSTAPFSEWLQKPDKIEY